MSFPKAAWVFVGLGIVFAMPGAVGMIFTARAQSASSQEPSKKELKRPQKDYYQRSLEIYEFRKAAKSGWQRGQEIFYYKCWYCHNEYQQDAVQLKGLFNRSQMLSGKPVNNDNVIEKIRTGGPGMAGYQYTLNDADLSDLLNYLREKCCWDSESVPLNPRYRAP